MPAQQGQTDEILKVTLTSRILGAHWADDGAAAGGKAAYEVKTQNVGDSAPIKITIKDLEGKTLSTVEGFVLSNLHRGLFTASAANATGGVTFEAELPKHGLKIAGGRLKTGKPIVFSALRFTDPEGKNGLAELPEGKPAACEAKVKGLKEGDKVLVSVHLRTDCVMRNGHLFVEGEVPVKDGKVVLLFTPKVKTRLDAIRVQADLDKEGGTYFQPEYIFVCRAGGVRVVSEPAKAVQELTINFWEYPGQAGSLEGKQVTITGPDGKKETKTIPKNGTIVIPDAKPGNHSVKGEKGLPLTGKILDGKSSGKKLDTETKAKIISKTAWIESGGAGYSALNLDYEFEGKFDFVNGWWKKKQARPDAQNKEVSQSKYFDTPQHVGLSFGLIQFTQQYLLGPLLQEMRKVDRPKFDEIFGKHSDELIKILTASGPTKQFEEELFDNFGNSMGAKKVLRRPSVMPVGSHDLWKPYWTARFEEAGKYPPFQRVQDKMAGRKFLDPIISYGRKKGMSPMSEKTLALLFDRRVQEGNVQVYMDELSNESDEKAYWRSVAAGKGKALRARMNKLMNDAALSWDLKYDL